MNILISGGSGYIGSYVTKLLLEKGYHVSVIARSENEFLKTFSSQIDVYYQDITKPFEFELNRKIDFFIHLGAANDIDSADPAYAINASVLGARYALDFCLRNSIYKTFYYSTFQVYGYVNGEMFEDSKLLPGNDYGITHQFAEQYFEMYSRTKSLEYIIIRPTNIFGSPMFKTTDRWSLVPSCFCKELIEKGEINLLSSGLQARDFISVQDIAKVNVAMIEKFDDFKNQVVNVSSGFSYTIREVAELVLEVYGEIVGEVEIEVEGKVEIEIECKVEDMIKVKVEDKKEVEKGIKGKLVIHSEEPKESNIFSLNRDKITRLGLSFDDKKAMKEEIKNIFKTLIKQL